MTPPNHGKHWSDRDAGQAATMVTTYCYQTIAKRLGRTEWGVRRYLAKRHNTPMQMHLATTAEVAAAWGCSVQYVARMARQRRIPAQRVPGGRNWLYPSEVLEMR